MGAPGKLLFLLHAHLPFVRHPDYERFLEEVVVISTAHGLKFTEFKVAYHEKSLEKISCDFANPIFKAPAKIGPVMDILKKEMAERRR
jgi:threonine synthase